jgi:hypothetical protein
MVNAYRRLYEELLSDRGIAERIRNKLAWMRAPVYRGEFTATERIRIVVRLLAKGILPGGPRRWLAFARTLPLAAPRKLPTVISDWITGLSMHSYVRRRFARDTAGANVEKRIAAIKRTLTRYLETGRLTLVWRPGRLQLDLTLAGWLDANFFTRAAPRLEWLLRGTHSTLILHVDELHAQHVVHLRRLLARLARYGDRISVVLHERLRALVAVDSSVFNLVLSRAGGRT